VTLFVHIADAKSAASIRRSGLSLPKARFKALESAEFKHGVFALPVISNFVITHQWVRELKRRGFRSPVGVYFDVHEDELVWASRYGMPKTLLEAAQAAALLQSTQELGFEVVLPRAVGAREIRRIKSVPHVGWRYVPGANGTRPFCGCSYCQRGNIKSRKLRLRYEAQGA
jgi:hypothetical protein